MRVRPILAVATKSCARQWLSQTFLGSPKRSRVGGSSDSPNIKFGFLLIVLLWGTQGVIYALDANALNADESTLFSGEHVSSTSMSIEPMETFGDKRSVSFSGHLDSLTAYAVNRDWASGRGAFSSNLLSSYNQADLFLDVRLSKGMKLYTDASITSLPSAVSTASASTVAFDVKEMFVDFNVDKQLYIRSGKQFMQWGRTYFWNPVDFVNNSQRSFFNLDAVRAGIYGTRLNWPLGQSQNAYAFFDMTGATNLTDLALLLRYEWLAGTSEWGLSVWNKYQQVTRYGVDTSTQFLGSDLSGELALSSGTNQSVISGSTVAPIRDRWVLSSTLGLSQTLNWERPNRISVHEEVFYNGAAYYDNILADPLRYALLTANNLYTANQLSAWYGAAFVSIGDFPSHGNTFTFNVLQNGVDASGVVSVGLSCQVVDGLVLNPSVAAYYGAANTEYLISGYGLAFLMQAVLTF